MLLSRSNEYLILKSICVSKLGAVIRTKYITDVKIMEVKNENK